MYNNVFKNDTSNAKADLINEFFDGNINIKMYEESKIKINKN